MALGLGACSDDGGNGTDSNNADAPIEEAALTEEGSAPATDTRMEALEESLALAKGLELGILDHSIQNKIGIREAASGESFLSLQIRLFNGGEARFSYIDRQFQLRSSDGSWSAKPELFAPDPDFGGSGTLMPGLAREGWMVFRIPESKSGLEGLEIGLAPELGEAPAAFLALPAE